MKFLEMLDIEANEAAVEAALKYLLRSELNDYEFSLKALKELNRETAFFWRVYAYSLKEDKVWTHIY